MKKKILLVLISCILVLTLGGCVNEKATITTTVYPVKYLIEQLAGDKVNVEYLSTDDYISNATIVDNYQEILEKTTLFVYIDELEPYLSLHPEVLTNYKFDVINLANLSAIYDFKRYTKVTNEGTTYFKESDYYDSELFEYVDTYEKDPYIWLDPIAMASMASTIKQWLEDYYPEDTLSIEKRFNDLQAILVRMDAEYQELNKFDDVKIVTVTPSFGNWQKLYGVEVYPIITSKYGVLPTDEQISVIKKYIKDNDVRYIVFDKTLSEELQTFYQEFASEMMLKSLELSSLSRLSQEDNDNGRDYITIMYANLANLENAFK